MPWYPDRRQRYAHSAPWEHTPGTPNAANTTKSEAKTTLATRQSDTYEQNEKGEHVLVKGNMSAGTAFRKTTQDPGRQKSASIRYPVAQSDGAGGKTVEGNVPDPNLKKALDSSEGTPSTPSGTAVPGNSSGPMDLISVLAKDSSLRSPK